MATKKEENIELEDTTTGFSFEINEEVETQEEGLGSNLGVGIHKGIFLTSISYNTPDEDDVKAKWEESLDFKFECRATNLKKDKYGNIIPDANGKNIVISRPGESIDVREFFSASKTDAAKQQKMLGRIKHILVKFMKPEEVIVSGKSFKELSENVIKLVGDKYKDTELRLKVIKNGKYSQVPKYMPFLERADLTATKLQLSAKEEQGDKPTNIADLDLAGEIQMPDLE